MEYNTTREKLILPEYGRNVQNMISHAMDIKDREERNRASQAIIEVMGQLNPHLRDVDDYRHKLWTHLFLMSDFKLDVDSPYETPKPEVLNERPDQMSYPSGKIKFGHYGKYTEQLLKKATEMDDPEVKDSFKMAMANFMKKQYLVHNNGAVENHVIAENLTELSNGNLTVDNPDELVSTNILLKTMGLNKKFTKPNKSNKTNYKSKKKKYKK
ncbi:DUF4290 domain-containing protein [Crocinitomicaceae bacterium]|jgi:hypothetical protein|nr:DUF4290 domain-containing protein [Flavobacteriales bacterium]MDA7762571.1 DUF4290 domain-containing protein [Crocinitomicaceae bacterium]MDC0459302.1 DUF4290 domain-containing protein [Crocinitomicaceae bacterium]MDO7613223.1 DUF4290 domain-containing protein [Crocinitomicaceae bacterium]